MEPTSSQRLCRVLTLLSHKRNSGSWWYSLFSLYEGYKNIYCVTKKVLTCTQFIVCEDGTPWHRMHFSHAVIQLCVFTILLISSLALRKTAFPILSSRRRASLIQSGQWKVSPCDAATSSPGPKHPVLSSPLFIRWPPGGRGPSGELWSPGRRMNGCKEPGLSLGQEINL